MSQQNSGDMQKEDIIIEEEQEKKETARRGGHIHILGMSLYVIAALVYVCVSVFVPAMWARLWVVFLAVPVIDSIPQAIITRRASAFNFSVLVVFVYLTVGMFCGIWHPTWLMFLAIPIWSWLMHGAKFFEIK